MHPDLAEKFLERVRLRVAQGDTPTEPALSRENLEDLVLTMDAELTAIRQRVVEVGGAIVARVHERQTLLPTSAPVRALATLVNEMETTNG